MLVNYILIIIIIIMNKNRIEFDKIYNYSISLLEIIKSIGHT